VSNIEQMALNLEVQSYAKLPPGVSSKVIAAYAHCNEQVAGQEVLSVFAYAV
jgi:hypothetical protein